jgi:hypothetical protein
MIALTNPYFRKTDQTVMTVVKWGGVAYSLPCWYDLDAMQDPAKIALARRTSLLTARLFYVFSGTGSIFKLSVPNEKKAHLK